MGASKKKKNPSAGARSQGLVYTKKVFYHWPTILAQNKNFNTLVIDLQISLSLFLSLLSACVYVCQKNCVVNPLGGE